jgi:acetyltransferase
MIDTAVAFTYCKPPVGRRIGLISNSGGGAVWMADMLIEQGFEIIPFDEQTRQQIEALLPAYGAAANPVDLTATAVRQVGYARMVEIVAKCTEVDSIVVIGSLAYEYVIEKDRDAFARVRAQTDKPIVFCTYTTASPRAVELLASAGIPAYTSMPNCVRAVRALADYGDFQRRWQRDRNVRDTRPDGVGSAVAAATGKRLLASPPALSEVRAKELLAGYGLPRLRERLAATEAEVLAAAREIGFPVALKAQSSELLHKTEAGAVAIGLKDETALREALLTMQRRIAPAISRPVEGFLVQQMAAPGLEMTVGITRDAQFGPMLMLGLGGVFVELLDDVVLAPVPVGKARVLELLRGLRGAKLFAGFRGMPKVDLEALADVAWRLSWFAHDQRDLIAEVDLNPVIVHADGVSIVDALIVRAGEEKGSAHG